jgi:hypothetical protein
LKELEKLTYDLERRPDYSPLAVYRAADRHNEGKLDKINLDRFFRALSIFLSERELLALIRRIDTTADQNISFEELRDFLEEQVGFRSHTAVVSMAKATPEVRSYMHNDVQTKQIAHVTVPEKIYGHESAP